MHRFIWSSSPQPREAPQRQPLSPDSSLDRPSPPLVSTSTRSPCPPLPFPLHDWAPYPPNRQRAERCQSLSTMRGRPQAFSFWSTRNLVTSSRFFKSMLVYRKSPTKVKSLLSIPTKPHFRYNRPWSFRLLHALVMVSYKTSLPALVIFHKSCTGLCKLI